MVADTPAVISEHAAQLPTPLTAARDAGAKLAIIDTAPHSTDAALAAASAADLVLIPCRASVADLHVIGTSIEITRQAGTAAAVVLNAAPVQGSLVKQARAAIAAYEVEMIPVVRVATRLVLKYNIRGGGDHHLGPQVLLAVELDALFDGDEADLAMDQRFHDLDHLPAVGDGFHGSVQ